MATRILHLFRILGRARPAPTGPAPSSWAVAGLWRRYFGFGGGLEQHHRPVSQEHSSADLSSNFEGGGCSIGSEPHHRSGVGSDYARSALAQFARETNHYNQTRGNWYNNGVEARRSENGDTVADERDEQQTLERFDRHHHLVDDAMFLAQ